MRINNSTPYAPIQQRKSQNVSFSGNKGGKVFKWVSDQCNIDSNSSLTRPMFIFVSAVFMVGARFLKARGEDERREILARDIPGLTIAGYGAPILNAAMAYGVTKHSGVPILTFSNPDKKLSNAKFATQKQVKDWYSNLKDLKDPLITFSETIERNGGNLNKVMKKLDLHSDMKAIVGKDDASNKEIIASLKAAQSSGDKKFKDLEEKIKNVGSDNKLFKMAKNSQAYVKLAGILFTAGILGVLIPRLNIVTTRHKYQHKNAETTQPKEQSAPQADSSEQAKKAPAKAVAFDKFI